MCQHDIMSIVVSDVPNLPESSNTVIQQYKSCSVTKWPMQEVALQRDQ